MEYFNYLDVLRYSSFYKTVPTVQSLDYNQDGVLIVPIPVERAYDHKINEKEWIRYVCDVDGYIYVLNRSFHNRNGPAVFNIDDGVREYNYYINGNFHRIGGPASISYYESGEIMSEHYFVNGQWHREDGPAHIEYHKNGQISSEEYFIYDEYHRIDKPALIQYDKNGKIMYKSYYINGKKIKCKRYK